MSETVQKETGPLFFREVVSAYVDSPRFLQRDWLVDAVQDKLDAPKTRCVLVTGAPGTGKSTFVAQLARDSPDTLVYFLRRNQRTPLAEGSAKSLLIRMGFQLASLHPELFEPDALRISITQKVETAEAGSAVVGARVKRLLASPFFEKILSVRQEVLTVRGRVTAIDVDEIIADPYQLGVSELQVLALTAPLAMLQRLAPHKRVLVLVDALDELRDLRNGNPLAGGGNNTDLLGWLGRALGDLPTNVQFVLTSRAPDQALEVFLKQHKSSVKTISLSTDLEHVNNDVERYAHALATAMRRKNLLTDPASENQFVQKAVDKANGNLGYLDAIARALDHALSGHGSDAALVELLQLEHLPDTLEELYSFFLTQVCARVGRQAVEVEDPQSLKPRLLDAWPAVYARLIAVLSVAFEPLTVEQLSTLSRIQADSGYITSAINDLRQFLVVPEEGNTFAWYHATVGEFLTSMTAEDSPQEMMRVDAATWHARIASFMDLQFSKEAITVDDYSLKYRVAHHVASDKPEKVLAAVTTEWMLHKRTVSGDDRSFHNDLNLAISFCLRQLPVPITQLVRLVITDAILLARMTVMPKSMATLWATDRRKKTTSKPTADLKPLERAVRLLALNHDPGRRTDALFHLADNLEWLERSEEARIAFAEGLEAAEANPYPGDRLVACNAASLFPIMKKEDAQYLYGISTKTVDSLSGPDISKCLEWHDVSFAEICARIGASLSNSDLKEVSKKLQHSSLKEGSPLDRACINSALAKISGCMGDRERAEDAASDAVKCANVPGVEGVDALCHVAALHALLPNKLCAQRAISRAEDRARELQGSNASPYTSVLVAATARRLGLDVNFTDEEISQAWQQGLFLADAAVVQLVSEAFAHNGDLSAARVAAEDCYQIVEQLHGRNQARFSQYLTSSVIPAFTVAKHSQGFFQILDVAAQFHSPGREWERSHILDFVSLAAGQDRLMEVLEEALVVARETKNVWERASALGFVGRGFVLAGDDLKPSQIEREIEEVIADGLRRQFPTDRLRGALVLTTLTEAHQEGRALPPARIEDLQHPAYQLVCSAIQRAQTETPQKACDVLKNSTADLNQYCNLVTPTYLVLKLCKAWKCAKALDTAKATARNLSIYGQKVVAENLLALLADDLTKSDVEVAADRLYGYLENSQPAEITYAFVDCLMSSGMQTQASLIADRVFKQEQSSHPDRDRRLRWRTAAVIARAGTETDGSSTESAIATVLDEARFVGMLSTVAVIEGLAPLLNKTFGTHAVQEILTVIDELEHLS